jgi:hypothetical protein
MSGWGRCCAKSSSLIRSGSSGGAGDFVAAAVVDAHGQGQSGAGAGGALAKPQEIDQIGRQAVGAAVPAQADVEVLERVGTHLAVEEVEDRVDLFCAT